LFGPLGDDGISAQQFSDELSAISGPLTLRVHSPGGDVFAGVLMHNVLAEYPGDTRVEIPALAASAASIVCAAGDVVAIGPSAHYMLHSCWSLCIGPARDMRAEAAILDSIDQGLIATYRARTGLSVKELECMLVAETWLRGIEAVQKHFADEILKSPEASARANFDLSVYQNVPASLASMAAPKRAAKIGSRADLERLLRDRLDIPNGAARKIAAGGFSALTENDAQTEIEELAARIAQANSELITKRKNSHDTRAHKPTI
jgi:ATP-dependent protease ClpP protease subunit